MCTSLIEIDAMLIKALGDNKDIEIKTGEKYFRKKIENSQEKKNNYKNSENLFQEKNEFRKELSNKINKNEKKTNENS